MHLSPLARWVLRIVTLLGLVFLYTPLVIVAILSFNSATSFSWPPQGYTLHWWSAAATNQGARDALFTSVRVAATLSNPYGIHNRDWGGHVYVCTGPRQPWAQLWPRLRHYD